MPSRTDPFATPSEPAYAVTRITNRLRAILLHLPYYSIEGNARLARDTGLSASTISRVARGKVSPSYVAVETITRAIAHRLGKPLDPREVFTTNGSYPTPSTCTLMGCRGCYPPEAWQEGSDTLRASWKGHKPGEWSRYPGEPETIKSIENLKPEEGSATKQVPSTGTSSLA